jgi:hypothetical protein
VVGLNAIGAGPGEPVDVVDAVGFLGDEAAVDEGVAASSLDFSSWPRSAPES